MLKSAALALLAACSTAHAAEPPYYYIVEMRFVDATARVIGMGNDIEMCTLIAAENTEADYTQCVPATCTAQLELHNVPAPASVCNAKAVGKIIAPTAK